MADPFIDLFFCDHVELPLPEGHKFPVAKYRMVREALSVAEGFRLAEAPLATKGDVLRVHAESYVEGFLSGTLDPAILRRIGFPWTTGLVNRTLASAGSTLAATQSAIQNGVAGTIAGGTHHAFRNEGSGFCVFNDLAIATEWARECRGLERIAIVDLDVHQGDGTASIFEGDDGVFTLSLHGARNFPFRKQRSRLDVEFPDGATGSEYLEALRAALPEVWRFEPQLVFFQSGVDGLDGDKLGRLALSLQDLAERDRTLMTAVRDRDIPLVVTMGGGYAKPIERTVEAHVQVFNTLLRVFRG